MYVLALFSYTCLATLLHDAFEFMFTIIARVFRDRFLFFSSYVLRSGLSFQMMKWFLREPRQSKSQKYKLRSNSNISVRP